MNQAFTLSDLLTFFLSVAGILVLVALFLTLLKVFKILKSVSEVLEKNREEIDSTISSLPEVMENVNGITKKCQ